MQVIMLLFFFFNDTATTEIYTLSLHDALPIWGGLAQFVAPPGQVAQHQREAGDQAAGEPATGLVVPGEQQVQREDHRSEEHTSELQSRQYLVCRLLLEKKKQIELYHLLILITQ